MKRTALAAALCTLATAALAQVGAPPRDKQLVISHRGASAYTPEHTFFAYDLAIAQNTDMLECDLILTKDEVPVCIHDETVDRTSESTGRVDSFTLAEMRAMDFGTWFNTANPTLADAKFVGAKIVPLEEQLDCYLRLNPKMRFHVETKDSAGGRAEQIFFDLLTRKGLLVTGDPAKKVTTTTMLLQSFDIGSLERFRMLSDALPTAYLVAAPTTAGELAGTLPDFVDVYAPNSAALLSNPSLIPLYHQNGHDVHTYTVNDAQQMGLLLDMGIDGIFTNNSDLLRTAVDARGNQTSAEERGSNPTAFAAGCPGIAGRVTSNAGPGDVWEPTGLRGVQLKATTATPSPSPGPTPIPTPTVPAASALDEGRFGGGALGGVLLGLFGLAARRRKLSR
ncbi:MAG: glycerophosphodiester phosphodiesterase family protein [Pseudomonadota bacterium]